MFKLYVKLIILIIPFFSHAVFADEISISTPLELSEKYRAAHEANAYDQIMPLVNWEGTRKPQKKKFEFYTTASFGMKIDNIVIEEVTDDQFKKYKIKNRELEPNLDVTHTMTVHFDVAKDDPKAGGNDTAVYLLGKNGENYMITVYVIADRSARTRFD